MNYKPFFFLAICMLIFASCKKAVFESSDANPEIINRQGHIAFQPITACEARDIRVFVHECLRDTEWEHAIEAAMDAYRNAPISVNFNETNNPNLAHVTITCQSPVNFG